MTFWTHAMVIVGLSGCYTVARMFVGLAWTRPACWVVMLSAIPALPFALFLCVLALCPPWIFTTTALASLETLYVWRT